MPSTSKQPASTPTGSPAVGVACALAAYLSWAFLPMYFKATSANPAGPYADPVEVLAHRVIWGVPILAVLLTLYRGWGAIPSIVKDARTMGLLTLTAGLIAYNWGSFTWATANDKLLAAGLAFFITPLFKVCLGRVFLGEHLTRGQTVAVCLAAAGVLVMAVADPKDLWLSLSMAAAFSAYAILRKRIAVAPMPGLFVEAMLMLPFAIATLVWFDSREELALFRHGIGFDLLLMFAGPATMLVLWVYMEGARRLNLATVGVMQYISPTTHTLLGVFWYSESFTPKKAVAFGCIWIAVVLYSAISLHHQSGRFKSKPPRV